METGMFVSSAPLGAKGKPPKTQTIKPKEPNTKISGDKQEMLHQTRHSCFLSFKDFQEKNTLIPDLYDLCSLTKRTFSDQFNVFETVVCMILFYRHVELWVWSLHVLIYTWVHTTFQVERHYIDSESLPGNAWNAGNNLVLMVGRWWTVTTWTTFYKPTLTSWIIIPGDSTVKPQNPRRIWTGIMTHLSID